MQKLTTEEINTISASNDVMSRLVIETGRAYLQMRALQKEAADLQRNIDELASDFMHEASQQDEFLKQLMEKYGEGELDLSNWSFISK